MNVTAGDQVEQGDILVRLDAKELDARVRQAEQSLAASEAARRQAEQDYNRAKSLHEKRAVDVSVRIIFRAGFRYLPD